MAVFAEVLHTQTPRGDALPTCGVRPALSWSVSRRARCLGRTTFYPAGRVEDLVLTSTQLLRASAVVEWVCRDSQAPSATSLCFAGRVHPLRFSATDTDCLYLYPPEYHLSVRHHFFADGPEGIDGVLKRGVVVS